ncbi:hypothetical protein [Halegenticoccus soli]|uniref:hypothetical protein n=1 Tax=Halegenticoccus soli TaxID=1985678 RepID=UPI000C6D1FDC|nr:hypothetical protein [Halegenticoccus soli]
MRRIALRALAVLAAAVSLVAHAGLVYATPVPVALDPLVLGAALLLLAVSALRRALRVLAEAGRALDAPPLHPTLGRVVGLNVVALAAYRFLPAAVVRGSVSLVIGASGTYLALAAVEAATRRRSSA